MKQWKPYKLDDFIEFNPTISLKKGVVATKITMDKIAPNCRQVIHDEKAPYDGGMKFQNNDTIMARITPCLENGKCAFISDLQEGEIAFGSTEYFVLRARPGISDPMFVYYLAISPEIKNVAIQSMTGTSGRQRAQIDVLQNYIKALPEIKEQQQIATILSSLDNKIELNRRINDNLEQQAQALFKSWFVDFEPFKDGKFVESELGMIPEGCRVGKAEDFYNINIGKTPPRKEQIWFSSNSSDYTWVSISDLGSCGRFVFTSSEFLTHEAIKRHNIILVPKDTILLSFKLTIGRVGIAGTELTTNEAIARFITSDENREYTYFLLKGYNYEKLGSTSSIATAVNSKIIKAMVVLMPDKEILKAFSSLTKPYFDQILRNEQESIRLTILRDTLLPKLMSGELKINATEVL